ncbi:MAG TPA: NAD-dependent epimerase/dehydratase family protein, partial [Acidimicrobiia bacterium]|nr:NAD-dependent epimerase/dehydratase family protein [Acidimicrobiia bacterium]
MSVRRRVLVTGGTGFVGANLVRRLLADGHAVHLLARPGHAEWRLAGIRRDVAMHGASLDDPAAVERVVRRVRPQWVFHLAAHGAYSWETDVDRIVATNVLGTVNLLRACVRTGFEAFVNAGSSSEYGFKRKAPTEREWVDPNSHYAVTKVAATHFCRLTAQQERVKVATLRLYSVYGPWEDPGRLMPTVVVHGLAGRLPPLVDPRVARDYVYVDDACDAFVRAAERPHPEPGPVFNVGTGVQTTIRDVVRIARRVLDVAERPRWGSMPNRGWDTSVWVA